MNGEISVEPIAYIINDYDEKFGVPRQSGLAAGVKSKIVFCEKFKDENALRGIEQFSHLWLIWGFSENIADGWSPTVRPPKLGGNTRLGVFATRSPFRPNNLGLSCVKLESVEKNAENGTVLMVSGADIMNKTPIYDIKPYIPYADCVNEATGGFAEEHKNDCLNVVVPDALLKKIPPEKLTAIKEVLSLDPRPQYIDDEKRIFGLTFAGFGVKFTVSGDTLTVTEING